MTPILDIQALSKTYGKIHAVNNLNLQVETGQIYGILGPNGSGKTTTLGIILGVIHANSGSYHWFGQKGHPKLRRQIGSLLETPNFYPYLNAVENLKIIAAIKGKGRENIEKVLKEVNLYGRHQTPVRTFSLGMKQRLALAGALLIDPQVLVLDEPTNGLDPQGIADVREIIRQKGKEGKTIIMASHILDEVEKTCSHVAVIKQGNLLAAGAINHVLGSGQQIIVSTQDLRGLAQVLETHPQVKNLSFAGSKLELTVAEDFDPMLLNQFAFEQGFTLSHLQSLRKNLETTFLELTAEQN